MWPGDGTHSDCGLQKLTMLNMYFSPTCAPETEKKNHCVWPRVPWSQLRSRSYSLPFTCTARRRLPLSKRDSKSSPPPGTLSVLAGTNTMLSYTTRLSTCPFSVSSRRRSVAASTSASASPRRIPASGSIVCGGGNVLAIGTGSGTKETPTGPFGAGSFACAALASGAEDFIASNKFNRPSGRA